MGQVDEVGVEDAGHDVVLTFPALAAYRPVAHQAARELARRRGFDRPFSEALRDTVDDALAAVSDPTGRTRVQLRFAEEPHGVVVTAHIVDRPEATFERTVDSTC